VITLTRRINYSLVYLAEITKFMFILAVNGYQTMTNSDYSRLLLWQ